eukprot:3941110-Rhodomonas_salina.1
MALGAAVYCGTDTLGYVERKPLSVVCYARATRCPVLRPAMLLPGRVHLSPDLAEAAGARRRAVACPLSAYARATRCPELT